MGLIINLGILRLYSNYREELSFCLELLDHSFKLFKMLLTVGELLEMEIVCASLV